MKNIISKRYLYFATLLLFCHISLAQLAIVDVGLSPAGSFKIKSTEVIGQVEKKGSTFEGKNIVVKLKNLQTGIELRDEHTKKHLDVAQFPEAILISARGQNGKGTGTIKIRGIEKPIEGTYEESSGKITARFPLKISDFNIGKVKYMGIGVKDNIEVTIAVPIKK